MRRYKPPYPAKFRSMMVDLHRAGRTLASLVKEFDVAELTIRKWVKQAELDRGERSDGLTSSEKEELAKLRRENARLQEERDILKRAAAWFAQEEARTRKPPSDS